MNSLQLTATAKAMVAQSKGLLAMDESTPTCNKRFEKVGIPQTVGGSNPSPAIEKSRPHDRRFSIDSRHNGTICCSTVLLLILGFPAVFAILKTLSEHDGTIGCPRR